MASVSPFLGSPAKFNSLCSEFDITVPEKKFAKFHSHRRLRDFGVKRIRVSCAVQEGDSKKNGEEPPESLFMKELRRRGMTPTSLLEESKKNIYETDEEMETRVKNDENVFSKRSAVSTDIEKELSNQRERSLALNSEGLEGLIPRAKLLLTLGGTFFLAFGPLILTTVAVFSALYLYFGPTFIHDGTDISISPPPYIDPYSLLEEDRLTQIPLRK
ncbi:hypothetical protein ACHQM5_016735 [Ranunculus cassubicifolius]